MGMAEKIGGEDSGGKARWCICGTIGIDMAVEEMREVNIRYVGRRRWRNGLEERRQAGQISTGGNYQPEGVSPLQ